MSYFTQETTQETQDYYPGMKRQRSNSYSQQRAATTIQRSYRRMVSKPSKSFVRNVKQVVRSLTETKQAYHNSGNSLTMFNSGIDNAGDMLQVIPSISQSTLDNGRIGDQIRAQKLNIKGYLKLNINAASGTAGDSTTLPNVIARLMVVSVKSRSNYTDAAAGPGYLATLLKKGGTTVGFTGLLSDINAPINTDAFTVHADRKIYLTQSYVNAIGASVPSQYLAQDISNTVKFFSIDVKCKNKLLKYDEDVGSGLTPTNFAPIMLLGYSYLDGSAPDTLSTNLGLQYISTLDYEDA